MVPVHETALLSNTSRDMCAAVAILSRVTTYNFTENVH